MDEIRALLLALIEAGGRVIAIDERDLVVLVIEKSSPPAER